jgi:hypothetical protein
MKRYASYLPAPRPPQRIRPKADTSGTAKIARNENVLSGDYFAVQPASTFCFRSLQLSLTSVKLNVFASVRLNL